MEPLDVLAALMRFVFCAIGSLGDVLPYLSLAVALRRRGHEVMFGANPRMADRILSSGVDFHPLGSERDAQRTEAHPKLWHPIDGLGVLWRHLAVPALKPTYALIEAQVGKSVEGGHPPPFVVCSPLALGARVARERMDFRLCMAYTAPMNLRRIGDPMFVGAWRVPHWMPAPVRRAMWLGLDTWKLQPMAEPSLLEWRRMLGLPELDVSVFGEWMHRCDHRLALFPSWFANLDQDFPDVAQIEFPLWDEAAELPAWTLEFFQSGQATVVVYPGSGARWVRRFVEVALNAVRCAGAQALIVSPHRDQVETLLGAGVRHATQLPFSRLFERVSCVVHHGGIGTAAQAMSAACPQVIFPSAYDQFENGWRVQRLGRGHCVPKWGRKRKDLELATNAMKAALSMRSNAPVRSGVESGSTQLEHWAGLTA